MHGCGICWCSVVVAGDGDDDGALAGAPCHADIISILCPPRLRSAVVTEHNTAAIVAESVLPAR